MGTLTFLQPRSAPTNAAHIDQSQDASAQAPRAASAVRPIKESFTPALRAAATDLRASVLEFNAYEPADIAALVSKEFVEMGRNAARLVRAEATLGAISAASVTLAYLANFGHGVAELSSLAFASSAAVGTGLVISLLRTGSAQRCLEVAKAFAARNFGTTPLYESSAEALDAAMQAKKGSTSAAVALRHAITFSPLLDPAARRSYAAKVAELAEQSFPGTLLHMDATTEMVSTLDRRSSPGQICAMTRNVLSLCYQPDMLERAFRVMVPSEHEVRRAELTALVPQLVTRLMNSRFGEPLTGCLALRCAIELIDGVLDPRNRNPLLRMQRENIIEKYIGIVAAMPPSQDLRDELLVGSKLARLSREDRSMLAECLARIVEE